MVVQDIPAAGFERSIRSEDAWAREALAPVVEGELVALSGHLRLTRRHDRVEAEVSVQLAAERRCERCDEPSFVSVDTEERLIYLPIPVATEGAEGERELAESELDVGWYEAGVIELGAVVAETAALALPPRVVCEDTASCDARTEALFAARGSSGTPGSAFAALGKLLN